MNWSPLTILPSISRGDELVAADDSALEKTDARNGFTDGINSSPAQERICGKAFESVRRAHLGDDTGSIAKGGDVHIMVHGIRRDHDISYIDIGTQGTGDAGVDQMSDVKAVDEDLGADGCIDFSHTAFDNDSFRIPKSADMEDHARFCDGFFRFHLFFSELFNLEVHSPDNTDFHFFSFLQHLQCDQSSTGADCKPGYYSAWIFARTAWISTRMGIFCPLFGPGYPCLGLLRTGIPQSG